MTLNSWTTDMIMGAVLITVVFLILVGLARVL